MRISGLSHREQEGRYQVLSASVEWEDSDRPTQEIFFRYSADASYFVAENYHPFLLATVLPALRFGERRIHVDGAVCPWLVDNLYSFMAYTVNWYWYKFNRKRDDPRLVTIEADSFETDSTKPARTASFFSGGVDSLYTVRRNQLNIPRAHSAAIQDIIFVHGFDIGVSRARGSEQDLYEFIVQAMQPFIEEANLNLITASTNVRTLASNLDIWLDEYMGSAMAAVAHGLCGRLSDVLISSSYDIPRLHAFSSHPMIEPRLCSFDLRIHHDGERLSRVERVKMIADWPAALSTLRVCFDGQHGQMNCGRCPKCIRTKLELVCAGKLEEAHTLPGGEPSVQEIRRGLHVDEQSIAHIVPLKHALYAMGRTDLAQAVAFTEWKYYLSSATNPRGLLTRFDKTFLKGALKRAVRTRK